MFSMFPCSSTPDSNESVSISLNRAEELTHSFESRGKHAALSLKDQGWEG